MNCNNFQKMMAKAYEYDLTGDEFKLFGAILLNMNEYYACNKTNQFLARFLNVSPSSVSKWVGSMVKKGILTVTLNVYKHLRSIKLTNPQCARPEPVPERAMTEAQLKFHKAFPKKAINCEIPKNVNIDLLIAMVKESRLKDYDNVSLYSCVVRYYDDIMRGVYRSDTLIPKGRAGGFSTERKHTKEETDRLYMSIEELQAELGAKEDFSFEDIRIDFDKE